MNKHILAHENSILSKFYQKTKLINELNELLIKILPHPENNHCRVANIRDQNLVLEIDDANWATKIRFMAPEILKSLQKTYSQINKIEWYVFKPQ